MNREEAREILRTYRPGVDWPDAAFHEAVEVSNRDPELGAWLREQGRLYDAVRGSLKRLPVPEDLAAKILARSAPARRPRISPVWQLAAALVALLAVAAFWFARPASPHPAVFADYRASMARLVSKRYPMSLETTDLERARKFLANNQSPADYVLPAGLKGTSFIGCSTLTWGANPVSMLCFKRADGSGLWLFVTGHRSLADAPSSPAPILAESNGMVTASWQAEGAIYVLASRGDFEHLRSYLEE